MKLLNCLRGILWMVACSTISVMAGENERPGQVAALQDLKPYLLLLDGADLSIDGSADGLSSDDSAEASKLRTLLSKKGTFLPWTDKKPRADFKKEHTISWHGEQRSVEVSLSLTSNEALVEVEKDAKKLRYQIAEEAKWEMVQLFTDHKNAGDVARALLEETLEKARAKSTPVEKSAVWRKSIAEGAVLTVHEGLPHPANRLYQSESRRKDVAITGKHAFYTPGVVAKNRGELAKLLADSASYHGFVAKECGDFHPDFAVSWSVNRQTLNLLICYGCHEVIFTDEKTSLRYDLDHEAGKKLEPLLKKNGGKRPVE